MKKFKSAQNLIKTKKESLNVEANRDAQEIDLNRDIFDDVNDGYKSLINKSIAFSGLDVDFFTRVKVDYIRQICRGHFLESNSLKALDVGCGVGSFHPLLKDIFVDLHGIDVSGKSIEIAEAKNKTVQYQVYDGKRLPYSDESFDVSITTCVLHHVTPSAWQYFIAELHRVIKKRGIAIIFEHNPRNPLTLRAVNQCPFDANATLLRQQEVVDLFTSSGFEDVVGQYILSVPSINSFMRTIDKHLSFLGLGAQYYVYGVK